MSAIGTAKRKEELKQIAIANAHRAISYLHDAIAYVELGWFYEAKQAARHAETHVGMLKRALESLIKEEGRCDGEEG
jgi:hypothetical protein